MTDPMFTATDDDRRHVANRKWELRKLIQQSADKLKVKEAKRLEDKGPKPDWLRTRPRGSLRCPDGWSVRKQLEAENGAG